jgi:hypothetical protein
MTLTRKAIITQSNYIPWKGYFDGIKNVDVFVVYDDMQYTRRDWRNRNLIKTVQGLKWLTIPVDVKGKYFQKINETRIAEKGWNNSHWDTIKQNYKSAKHYKEMSEWLEPLFRNCNYEFLTEVNMHFINGINNFLGVKTEIKYSSEFELAEEKNQRLVNICKDLEATDYFSGPAAKAYMDIDKFTHEKINVHYFDYSGYPEYNQLYKEFEHGVSIIDLILNEGYNSINFLKN